MNDCADCWEEAYVGSQGPWDLLDFKLDLLALFQGLVSFHFNGGIMREHVAAVAGRDKPYPLLALNHFTVPSGIPPPAAAERRYLSDF
jgi:hypothetical protein